MGGHPLAFVPALLPTREIGGPLIRCNSFAPRTYENSRLRFGRSVHLHTVTSLATTPNRDAGTKTGSGDRGRSTVTPVSASSFGQGNVLYFAYASNLNPQVMGPDASYAGRRAEILSARQAFLPQHRLAYYPTGLPNEPAMATVVACNEDDARKGGNRSSGVRGMLFELSYADFVALSRSEAALPSLASLARRLPVPLPVAEVVSVRVQLYPASENDRAAHDEWTLAQTFVWPAMERLIPFFPNLKPSARYMLLISKGYQYYGLDHSIDSPWKSKACSGLDKAPVPTSAEPSAMSSVFAPDDSSSDSGVEQSRSTEDGDVVSFAIASLESDAEWAQKQIPSLTAVRLVRLTLPDESSDGPPRPVLFYVPGIDGSGYSIVSQIMNLTTPRPIAPTGFDVFAARIPFDSRESGRELALSLLASFADAVQSTGAPYVIVLGESMGGALVQQIGVENGRVPRVKIDQLVMVNPASGFRRSELSSFWIQLSSRVPSAAYNQLVGPLLVPFILDPSSIPVTELSTTGLRRLKKLRAFLDNAGELLPQGAVVHRLALLNSFQLSPAEYDILGKRGAVRTRLIVAENDSLLPVVQESAKLLDAIPGLERACFPFGGHAMLQDNRVDIGSLLLGNLARRATLGALAAATASSPPVPGSLRHRVSAARWAARDKSMLLLPNRSERRALAAKLELTRSAHAPVVLGTERLPTHSSPRPVLFVSNHTLLGALDAVLLMSHILEHKNKLVRSLAHPGLLSAFDSRGDESGKDQERSLLLPGLGSVTLEELQRFGISQISPRALVRELANDNWVLIFPGGAREGLKRKQDRKYSLHWPESPEFVRTAAAFGALIVPVATIGQEESVNMLLDSSEVLSGLKTVSRATGWLADAEAPPSARRWKGSDSGEPVLAPPLLVPASPDRLYLRFGDPIEVPPEAETDRELAALMYKQISGEVRSGIENLHERRQHDRYRNASSRLAFRAKFGTGPPPASPAWTWETRTGPVDD